jgi:hypothetical protein
MLNSGNLVKYKSRKWIFVDFVNGKALLKLAPNEKPFIQNYQDTNMVCVKLASIKIIKND